MSMMPMMFVGPSGPGGGVSPGTGGWLTLAMHVFQCFLFCFLIQGVLNG